MKQASIVLCFVLTIAIPKVQAERKFDLVIYGGSPAGLMTAIAAARQDPQLTIAILEPSDWIGGVVSGGLSRTDKGNPKTIGGLTREYFELARSLGGEDAPLWYAEPRHNLAAFRAMLAPLSDRVKVIKGQGIKSIEKDGLRIRSVTLQDGTVWHGKLFVDASYEGDLMAGSGISYIVGRESRSQYGEPLAGYTPMPIRIHDAETMGNVCKCLGGDAPHFIHGTPAKIAATDDRRKLIAGVFRPDPKIQPGDADGLTQAYNFRLCVTQREDIRIPFPKPASYEPRRYELLLRLIRSYPRVPFGRLVHLGQIASGKYDLNAQGLFSTDYPGGNIGYPEGDAATRQRIRQDHVDYIQGMLWFLGHDSRVPADLRAEVNAWGLCADEFTDNENWPYALYVREARRMIGQHVMCQQDTWTQVVKPDSVGMGSFVLDCHIVQRIATPDGMVTDEGSFQDTPTRPYQIPYRSLLPKRAECENLLVPVCLSASHVAYCSIRMEPVYMAMGQACGVASALAMKSEQPNFHDVDVVTLRKELRTGGAVLELKGLENLITIDKLDGIAQDERSASLTGNWTRSGFGNPVEGMAIHDGNGGKGKKSATFSINIPESGRYEVRFAYAASANRASSVPLDIKNGRTTSTVRVDQRKKPEHAGRFTTLGTFNFTDAQPLTVTIRNDATDSYVSVDAIQVIRVD